MRKNLLFIVHTFPPVNSVSCIRSWNVATRLADLGWRVTILTPHPEIFLPATKTFDIAAAPSGLEFIYTDYHRRYLFPTLLADNSSRLERAAARYVRKAIALSGQDMGVGWVRPAVEAACARLSSGDIDLIWATGAPFAAFQIAERLGARLRCPYALDYRDPWTVGNPHNAPKPFYMINTERRIARRAARLVTVSYGYADAIKAGLGLDTDLDVLTNGYDADSLSCVEPTPFEAFTILYAGRFYQPKRVITPVFAALRLLKDAGERGIAFRYYGDDVAQVREEAARHGISDMVVAEGKVSRATVLSATAGAGMAVVISSVQETADAADRGIIPGKVFEVMGLGTPILLIAPDGSDLVKVVEEHGTGTHFTGSQVRQIADHIRDAARLGKQRTVPAPQYSWEGLAQRLDGLLTQTIRARRAPERKEHV